MSDLQKNVQKTKGNPNPGRKLRDFELLPEEFPIRRCVSESYLETKRQSMLNKVDKTVQVDMDLDSGSDAAGGVNPKKRGDLKVAVKAKCLELKMALANNKKLHEYQFKLMEDNVRFRGMLRTRDDSDVEKMDIDPFPFSSQVEVDDEEDCICDPNDYLQDDSSDSI